MRYLCFVLCALIWVVNGEDCVDKVDFCHNIVYFKTCGLYQSQVNCRKSCNLCNDCVDKVDFCHNIVHFKTCGLYQSQVNCRKSCKLCDKPMPPAPPTEDP
uniref:ShKT domain-containing protein n=1 Tax=Ascaris lumbricoides TaxID=6252 RepID=A0A0M3IIJ8_ASCLU